MITAGLGSWGGPAGARRPRHPAPRGRLVGGRRSRVARRRLGRGRRRQDGRWSGRRWRRPAVPGGTASRCRRRARSAPSATSPRRCWARPESQDLDVAGMRERLLPRLRSDGDVPPLVVEDAHWIDAASADVLRFLGRRIGCHPRARRRHGPHRDDLQPPAAPGARRPRGGTGARPPRRAGAVGGRCRATRRRHADRSCRGLPADAWQRLPRSQLPLDPHTRVGRTVRDAVAARLAPLEGVTRELLELLSVIPGRSDVDLLGADLSRLDEAVVAGVRARRCRTPSSSGTSSSGWRWSAN